MSGIATFAALTLLLLSPRPGAAQDAAGFYRGRNVFLQVGSGAGEGYDQYARLVARFIGRHIPGEPHIVVQNIPGGGSFVLANQFGNVTPRDGSVFGMFNNGMPTTPLLNPGVAKFDPRKFSFIGSPNREVQVFISWHTSPAQTLADAFTREIIVGASAPGAAPYDFPLVTNALLGTRFRIITGSGGTAAQILAMQRGEIHANPAVAWVTAKTQYAPMIADRQILLIGQFGFRPHPDIPDVPLFPTGANEADRQIFELLYARQEYGRPLLFPPDVPAERVAALRAAFDATMKDPDFRAEAQRLKIDIVPVAGVDMQNLTDRLFRTPPAVLERIQTLLGAKPANRAN